METDGAPGALRAATAQPPSKAIPPQLSASLDSHPSITGTVEPGAPALTGDKPLDPGHNPATDYKTEDVSVLSPKTAEGSGGQIASTSDGVIKGESVSNEKKDGVAGL